MKNQLFTRNTFLGILMTLVLAFGVIGIADAALTAKKSTEKPDFIFTDGSTKSSVNTFKFTVTAASAVTTNTITITPPSGAEITNITALGFTRTGNVIKPTSNTSVTDGDKTVTVSYTVTTHGQRDFKVGNLTLFTAYALESDRARSSITDGTSTPQVNGQQQDQPFAVTIDAWVQVDLSISGGYFIIQSGIPIITGGSGNQPTSFSTFTTSTSSTTLADVRVNSGQTAKVTARIPGSNASNATRVVTYFFNNNATLKRISGNNQFGPTNPSSTLAAQRRQLNNPLVVRVLDGTTRGVGGQDVAFDITTSGTTAILRSFSSALLGDSNDDGSITNTDDNREPITVKTDSQGYAKVYLVPGASAASYTVSAAVSGTTSVLLDPTNFTFTASAIQSISGAGSYVIDKASTSTTTTPQRRDPDIDSTMTVNVKETGTNISNAQVKFTVTGGRITLTSGSNYQSSLSTVTDSNGNATVHVQLTGSSSAIVTAQVVGNYEDSGKHTVTYFYNYPYIEYVSGNNQSGSIGGRVQDPLVVRVLDGQGGRPVSEQIVHFSVAAPNNLRPDTGAARTFIPVPGTNVFVTALNTLDSNTTGTISNSTRRPASTSSVETATTITPSPGAPIYVQTDSRGEAEVYLRLGNGDDPQTSNTTEVTDLNHVVTATTPNGTPSAGLTFRSTAVAGAKQAKLEIVSGDGQSAAKGDLLKEPLVVRVRTLRGYLLAGIQLKFSAPDGSLLTDPDHDTALVSSLGGGNEIRVRTGSDGEAWVDYNVGQLRIARKIRVEVIEETSDSTYGFAIDEVEFGVNGGQGTGSTPPPATTQPTTPSLSISTTGEGATREVTVTASNGVAIGVTLGGTALTASQVVTAGTATTITLPTIAGTYTLTATAPGYTAALPTRVTVAAATQTGTLSLASVGAQVNGQQTIQVTARTSAGALVTTPVTVTLSGAGVSKTVSTTATGSVNTIIALPTTAGTLTASATGYTSGTLALPARTTTTTTTPTTTPTASEPASISISGPGTRSGVVNEELEAALLVQVLDADGEGVEDARVTFRVRTGQGRLSQRGNGRAIAVRTNAEGYARADYTPLSARSTVEASVTGVTRTVTFTITATGSVPTTTDPGGTPGTTAIDPKILVGAGNRPAMVWVDNGMLYGLTGAEATKIAEKVNDAAIGGGKVYWTEKTGASAGTINGANPDGTQFKTLATIKAVPMGIAVDTAGKKLYWTNSRGRVQSANLNGSGIRNVQQNLIRPSDIALGNGHIYWIEDGSSIRRVNVTGTKVVKDVAVGLMDVGGIAVGDGKVYWTEKTGASAGTISGANADGTQFKTLAKIKAVPMGIAVDTAGKKLYWTNSRGRVQSANLNGSSIRNVVDGLGTPSHLAIGSASQGTTAAKPATKPATQPTKKDTTAYDVNGDGTVDNTDASLVSEAMGTDNKKYDVNGDGTVNFFDLMLVFDNRDAEAAAAPTIVGMQLSSVQIAVIEEQIDLLIATGDRSPTAMRTLVYLQQLIATARPEKTQLLANYPNPFNPETWIPYELATDTDVRITIYNAQGVVIRTLQLGQQSAGYYTDRERAAYWDGRNAIGEQVASGLYFYQLETDDMSSLRKMVILK